MKPNIRLTYLNVRGKLEAIRILLEDQRIPYLEHRYSLEDWKTKYKMTLPFNQLPLYEELDTELSIVQTQAIMRHLGRKFRLYGGNEKETIRCDILQEAILDAREDLIRSFGKDFETLRDRVKSEFLPARLNNLQKYFLSSSSSKEFCVGKDVTYVDYLMWVYLDYVRAFSLPTLQSFGHLSEWKTQFEKGPGIDEYLKSERRPKCYTLPHFKWGNTPETS